MPFLPARVELTKLIAIAIGSNLAYHLDFINETSTWFLSSHYLLPLLLSIFIPFILKATVTYGAKAMLPVTTTSIPLLVSILLSLLIYFFSCHWDYIPELFDGMCLYYMEIQIGGLLHVTVFQRKYAMCSRDVWFIPDISTISFGHSLLLNRKNEDRVKTIKKGKDDFVFQSKNIVVAATMYHENGDEMKRLIHSLCRLDETDQSKEHITFCILFDDACRIVDSSIRCNEFVRQLVELLAEENVRFEYEVQWFGAIAQGRFENGTPITLFLKTTLIKTKQKDTVKFKGFPIKDTFVLFTDGDTYFSPSSIQKLCFELNADVFCGAISGRVYPSGKRYGAWYQKFEYASSHWLQKQQKKKLGSVLCCPGCFTLLRLECILNEFYNKRPIYEIYSEQPTSGVGVLTHNFGEDRWLSYLLVERGWGLKYCSITKSKSFCPTTTREFFNQRRRWLTSTWANTAIILKNWKTIKKHNPRISTGYMLYILFNFLSIFITPSTTLLFSLWIFSKYRYSLLFIWSTCFSSFPALIFMFLEVFFMFKKNQKLEILTVNIIAWIYAFEMFLLIINMIYVLIFHPTFSLPILFCAVFFLVYAIAITLHAEFKQIIGAIFAFFLAPTYSVLLIIYSFMHLADVSWGTREQKQEDPFNFHKIKKEKLLMFQKMKSKLVRTQGITIAFFFVITCIWVSLTISLMLLDTFFPFTLMNTTTTFLILPTSLAMSMMGIQFLSMLAHRLDSLAFILARLD
ncbi:chitin synthase [Entamoeba marina]